MELGSVYKYTVRGVDGYEHDIILQHDQLNRLLIKILDDLYINEIKRDHEYDHGITMRLQ